MRGAPGALLRRVRRSVQGFYAAAGVLLATGMVLSLAGLWALGGLTEEVLEGETLRFDQAVLLWLNARATPGLDVAALRVTALGDTLVVLTVALVAGSLLWLLGQRAYAALLAAAVGGAVALYPVLKMLFDRPRPQLFEWRAQHAASASYPSGHATMSVVLLVVLAYVVHRLARRRAVGVAAALVAGTGALLIGLSRLYLGVHYPSDVAAGAIIGFAWAVFCALGVEALRGRRGAHGPGGGSERAAGNVPDDGHG